MFRLFLLSFLVSSVLVSSSIYSQAGQNTVQNDGKATRDFSLPEYTVSELSAVEPSEWEQASFDLQSKKIYKLRSTQSIPGVKNTFYRFIVTVETYESKDEASVRIVRLHERPPGLTAEESKAFPLRRGFQKDKNVYIVSTDAALFDQELDRVTEKLKTIIK